MEFSERDLRKSLDNHDTIPIKVRDELYDLIPHNEKEIIDRVLSIYMRGFKIDDEYILCPECHTIEKSRKEYYCKECGTCVNNGFLDKVLFQEIIFSNDSELKEPAFYFIKLKYNFISKEIELVVDELSRTRGDISVLFDIVYENVYVINYRINPLPDITEKFLNHFHYTGYNDLVGEDPYYSSIYNQFTYCLLYMKYPHIERLLKTKYSTIIIDLVRNHSCEAEDMFRENIKNEDSKKLKQLFVVPEWMLDDKATLFDINNTRLFYETYKPSAHRYQEYLKFRFGDVEKDTLKQVLDMELEGSRLYTFDNLISYIGRCEEYQGISPRESIQILKDYLSMCLDMEVIPALSSKTLRKDHNDAVESYKLVLDNIIKNKFISRAKELTKYFYENGDFEVVIPEIPQDLVNEGQYNNNCVATYVGKFAEGISKIFFVRKKIDLKSSYVTLEMRGDEIVQAFLSSNRTITDDKTLLFIDEWRKQLKEKKII